MRLLLHSLLISSSLLAIGKSASDITDISEFCKEPHWHLCANKKCISSVFVCDGEDECGDNSDESNCPDETVDNLVDNLECSSNQFKCEDNTRCIPIEDICDRQHDCPDGSDEYIGCTINLKCHEFRCNNGYCLQNEWLCDGVDDCGDWSDEKDCSNRTIPPEQCNNEINRFLCNNGRCLSLNKTCDINDDCGDDSDENIKDCKIAEESCKIGIGCSHICKSTPRGPACACPVGHKLVNNKTCTDVNECSENSELCDQRCVNTAGSYYCICEVGYDLQDDKKTCKAAGGEAMLVFSSKKEIRAYFVKSQVYFPIAQDLHHVLGVSLDSEHIYWSDIKSGDEAIYRSRDDGSKPEVIVTSGLGLPEDIAVDWVTSNIYFTDSVWKHIGVCKSDGSYCTVVISESMDRPRGLALYPVNGEMFWSDFGEKPHISVAGMDGRERKLVVWENLVWPNGLAIDYPKKRLYWVDAKLKTIESVKLDGSDRRQVLKSTAMHPYSIAIFENKLYWSDWDSRSIQSVDKVTGKNRTVEVRELEKIYGIHVFHSVLKPRLANPCNTKPCQQLCLLAANRTYSCACTMDKELSADRHTCKITKKQERLIIAADRTFVDYHHEILGKPKLTASLTVQQISHMAYDSITGTIIASDQLSDSIFRFNPDSDHISEAMKIANEYIGGMDFDSHGNNIYWSDLEHRTIEIHSFESGHKSVLHFMEEPRDVLLIPESGIMFVVFKSRERFYHIDKLQMSSAEPREHVVDGLQGPKISLAHDKETGRIFFADEGAGSVESISIRGTDRKIFRTGLRAPVALAILDRYAFWTLKKSKLIQWADKHDKITGTKSATINVPGDAPEAMDLVTMRGVYADTQHKCRLNNGGCSHVCLVAVTQHHVCACPPGMILNSDKRSCIMQTQCTADEIRCSDNNMCISKMRKCNGVEDCPNGEDEEKCDVIKRCGVGEFMCRNGQCIDTKNRCNSYIDCADKSDEANCDKESCKNDEFQCLDGECISKFLLCDRHNDCSDFSDETNCGRHVCDEGSFRCPSGNCIPKSWECDGVFDCEDSSDEDAEKCKLSRCPDNMFQCENDVCLDRGLVCDEVNDCGDNSDEKNCNKDAALGGVKCTANQFKCHGTEKCISLELRCNGVQDCPKNDDERRCTQCESDEFACENKKCIQRSWVCDHFDDCGDKSDEKNCEARTLGNFTTSVTKSAECKQFRCATGTCLPYEKVCDGKRDCLDGSDEDGKCESSCTHINPCEKVCLRTPSGPLCQCHEGFALENDGKSCRDIDECQQGICPQICLNQLGSFECMCHEGYVLRSNRISCKVAGDPMEIITATKADIRKISADVSSIRVIHRQPNVDVTGLDVNMHLQTVYWSNELLGTINKLNLRTNEFKLLSGLGRPGMLAIDWATNNVYFHDGAKPTTIKVCSLEEEKCANIVKIEDYTQLRALAVDPKNGWLFWSQTHFVVFQDSVSEIYRSDMSGSGQLSIATDNLGDVSGITIDHMRSHLYWVDSLLQVVERSDLDGKNREIVLKQQIHQPLGINIFEDSIYWLMRTSGILKKCELHGDRACQDIQVRTSNVYELFVISQKSRQPTVRNACENHQCSHMCVLKNDDFGCICASGLAPTPNDTCIHGPDGTSPLKFETIMLGLKKSTTTTRSQGGLFTGVVVTIALGISMLSAYYYYQKKKYDLRNKHDLSLHFQNPSYGRPHTELTSDFVVPVLPAHEYTNPMTEVHIPKKPANTSRRTLEIIDHSENEQEDEPYTHSARLIG